VRYTRRRLARAAGGHLVCADDRRTRDLKGDRIASHRDRLGIEPDEQPNVKVISPVFIHPTAELKEVVIGPNVSIGPNCMISQSTIQECIIEEGTQITKITLTHSIIGSNCVVEGRSNQDEAASLNIGDNSYVYFTKT